MYYLIASACASLLLYRGLRERALYVLFPWAYAQNFVLAWMYTSGTSKELCQALLLVKEFLLLWLFLAYWPKLWRNQLPLPMRILVLFTAWCVVRYLAAVLLQGERFFSNLWNLREMSFPLQAVTIAFGISAAQPRFVFQFMRRMTFVAGAAATIGLVLYFVPSPDFWRDRVNIARYNAMVKGESDGDASIQQQLGGEDKLEEAQGLPGNARGREEFSAISEFRAFGTVGDAVGFGHLVAFAVLLFAFGLNGNMKNRLAAVIAAAALFLTFTRSAWIVVLLSSTFILLHRRKYGLVFGTAGIVVAAALLWTPISEWYSETTALLSWSNPQEDHAQGLVWLYKEGLWNANNVLGQGLAAPVYEGGYGILLVRYGVPAVALILAFFASLYYSLRQSERDDLLFVLAQALPLAMIVTMNTSYYPFSFVPYLLPWFVLGTCLELAERKKNGELVLQRADRG